MVKYLLKYGFFSSIRVHQTDEGLYWSLFNPSAVNVTHAQRFHDAVSLVNTPKTCRSDHELSERHRAAIHSDIRQNCPGLVGRLRPSLKRTASL